MAYRKECANRANRIRIPFNVTITGTNSAADLVYAEGQGAVNYIDFADAKLTDLHSPSGADADSKKYSTLYIATSEMMPASWQAYFIIRKSNYWEIYYGSKGSYGLPNYTLLYRTKNAFPTLNSGGRLAAGRTSAEIVTGTRPPEEAVWIRMADNAEIPLTLSGVSEDYSTLPVTLTYFNAKLTETKKVDLKWETTSELNSDYFAVERSADMKAFMSITKVKAKENSAEQATYHFTDETPIRGIGYYRLKQVDLDGTYTYSRVVSVRTEGTDAPYPNPSDGKYLMLDVPATADINLINVKGETISFERKSISETSVQLLPKNTLLPGMYIVTANGLSRTWVVQ